MLGWAVVFLIIAIVAAVFGFGGIAAASAGIAKFLFFLFLMMFIIFLIFGGGAEASPDPRSGFRRVCGFDVILLLVCCVTPSARRRRLAWPDLSPRLVPSFRGMIMVSLFRSA